MTMLIIIKTCIQFHQHFTSSFCIDILLPKSQRAELLLEKSCAKHYCTKRLRVKCWWIDTCSQFQPKIILTPFKKASPFREKWTIVKLSGTWLKLILSVLGQVIDISLIESCLIPLFMIDNYLINSDTWSTPI